MKKRMRNERGQFVSAKGLRKKAYRALPAKAKVYVLWRKGIQDVKRLEKLSHGHIKPESIKKWVGAWPEGRCLPSQAEDRELMKEFGIANGE
jgi:hypothetical protein